jgi:voltage-gated potassium channel
MSEHAVQDRQAACEGPTPLDCGLAPVMFWLTILWLGLLGTAVHLIQDSLLRESGRTGNSPLAGRFDAVVEWCTAGLLLLTPAFLLEGIAHWLSGAARLRQNVWQAVFPFLRLTGRDHGSGKRMWLPTYGWATADDNLEANLERKLSVPMIVVALLVLPVLAVEFLWQEQARNHPQLALATHLTGAFIWLAFAVEFLILLSITPKRLQFLRRHWLDLAIICLPLIAFLRVLRVGRLGRLLRLQQVVRLSSTSKTFRLKGLAIRVWRGILLLEVFDRLLRRDAGHKLEKLRMRLKEVEDEAELLRRQVEELEAELAGSEVIDQGTSLDAVA